MKTFALRGMHGERASSARSLPTTYTSFWTRETTPKAVDVPQVPALNLLPPDTVPERVLRKIAGQYDNVLSSPDVAFGAPCGTIDQYIRFGEECASRNMVPSFRLFGLWLEADKIGEV